MKLFWIKNLDRILARAVVVLDIFEVFEVLWVCCESISIERAVLVLVDLKFLKYCGLSVKVFSSKDLWWCWIYQLSASRWSRPGVIAAFEAQRPTGFDR